MNLEIITLILNALLSGSLIVTLVTLKATRKKANANANAAEASAERTSLENDRYLSENINSLLVSPLKKEMNALRKVVQKLQKAIDKVSDCPHSDNCPVIHQLQHNQENNNPDE